jgi:hypothetical protein
MSKIAPSDPTRQTRLASLSSSSSVLAWRVSDKGKGGGRGGYGVEGGHEQNEDNNKKKILKSTNYEQMKAKSITLTKD